MSADQNSYQVGEQAGMQPISELADLFQRLGIRSDELELIPLRLPAGACVMLDAHRQAIRLALQILEQQCADHVAALNLFPRYADGAALQFQPFVLREDLLATAVTMSARQFLGPGCDLEKRRLLLGGESKNFPRVPFWFGDREIPKNIIDPDSFPDDGSSFTSFYLDALDKIPGGNASINADYFSLLDQVSGGMQGEQDIYIWNPDCTCCFDLDDPHAERHLWIFHHRGSNQIIVIVKATTD